MEKAVRLGKIEIAMVTDIAARENGHFTMSGLCVRPNEKGGTPDVVATDSRILVEASARVCGDAETATPRSGPAQVKIDKAMVINRGDLIQLHDRISANNRPGYQKGARLSYEECPAVVDGSRRIFLSYPGRTEAEDLISFSRGEDRFPETDLSYPAKEHKAKLSLSPVLLRRLCDFAIAVASADSSPCINFTIYEPNDPIAFTILGYDEDGSTRVIKGAMMPMQCSGGEEV